MANVVGKDTPGNTIQFLCGIIARATRQYHQTSIIDYTYIFRILVFTTMRRHTPLDKITACLYFPKKDNVFVRHGRRRRRHKRHNPMLTMHVKIFATSENPNEEYFS